MKKEQNWVCGKCEQEKKGVKKNQEIIPFHTRHCEKRNIENLIKKLECFEEIEQKGVYRMIEGHEYLTEMFLKINEIIDVVNNLTKR